MENISITPAGLLITIVSLLSITPANYAMSRMVARKPFALRDMLLHCAIVLLETILNRLLMPYVGSATLMLVLLTVFSSAWLVFGARGRAFVLLSIKLLVAFMALEPIALVFQFGLIAIGYPMMNVKLLGVEALLDPFSVFTTCMLSLAAELSVCGILYVWRRFVKHEARGAQSNRALYVKAVLRITGLVAAGVGVIQLGISSFVASGSGDMFTYANRNRYMLSALFAIGLVVIALSYLTQDLRLIAQLKRNETLAQQQAISRSLLQNMRYFRHNMLNMLYGLEGVMISGDAEQLRAYYQEMTEKCALVNNENIVSLERISNPSVSAVLLRAVDRARLEEIPLNLYVKEGTRIGRSLQSSDLCQVLGVLLDNALDAAKEAQEKFVSVTFQNVEDTLELVIKNTYAGEITEEQLQKGGASTKPGHSAQGLKSCYDILARQRAAYLNFMVSGQYVQAQLLVPTTNDR